MRVRNGPDAKAQRLGANDATIRCFAREVSLAVATMALAATEALADEPIRSFGAIQQVFTASCALTSCHSAWRAKAI
jgi:hypothetical protein